VVPLPAFAASPAESDLPSNVATLSARGLISPDDAAFWLKNARGKTLVPGEKIAALLVSVIFPGEPATTEQAAAACERLADAGLLSEAKKWAAIVTPGKTFGGKGCAHLIEKLVRYADTHPAPPKVTQQPAAAIPDSAARVLVFGDSITKGSGAPSPAESWLARVNASPAANAKLFLLNEGKGGRPATDTDGFADALARHNRVDALVLALGANDARDVSGACVPNATAALRKMIAAARAKFGANLPILLIAPPNINPAALAPEKRPTASQRAANLAALEPALRDLAASEKTAFASLLDLLPPETLAADGVHPDASGHALIAGTLLRPILQLIN
jgi:acyl-CoA thioesterase-1